MFNLMSTLIIFLCYMSITAEFFVRQMAPEGWMVLAVICASYWKLTTCNEIRTRPLWPHMCMLVAVLLFIVATVLDSPWIAMVSGIHMLWTVAIRYRPRIRFPDFFRWQILTLMILPLPLGYGSHLTHRLQLESSHWASRILDFAGVIHWQKGNLIELPSKQLMVEEACSGIASMQALAIISVVLIVLYRLNIVASFITGASIVLWAMIGNLLRIVAVAIAEYRWQMDIASGPKHEVLGIVTFFVAAMLIILTGVVCKNLTRDWNVTWWSRWQCKEDARIQPLSKRLKIALLFIFVIATVFHLGWTPNYDTRRQTPAVVSADWLPTTIGNWQLSETSQRTWGSIEDGAKPVQSQIWLYSDGHTTIRVAVDYPFYGYHHLEDCYKGIGYTLERQEETADYVRCFLTKAGKQSIMDYVLLDGKAVVHTSPTSQLTAKLNRVGFTEDHPNYQIQILAEENALPDTERRKILQTVCQAVLQKIARAL